MSTFSWEKIERCPYCIVADAHVSMQTLRNGSLICEQCGHIAFLNEPGFVCPCMKCLVPFKYVQ
jgi:hypothetical protein